MTIGVVLHDLNQAAVIADRIVLLDRGRVAAVGTPAEVYDAELLSGVYEIGVDVILDPATAIPTVLPRPRHRRASANSHPEENACVPATS